MCLVGELKSCDTQGDHVAKRRSLPILTLKTPEQHYSCRGCGRCCRHFTVQLRPEDVDRLDQQGWYEKLGQLPYVEFRGQTYLRQTDGGACVFLQDDGRCRIHAEFGLVRKPIACQMFPFTLMPSPQEQAIQTGLSFACPSVIENHGAGLDSHNSEVRRMSGALPELQSSKNDDHRKPIEITPGRIASSIELKLITSSFINWFDRIQLSMRDRLHGAAVLTTVVADAVGQGYSDHDLEMVFDMAFLQLEEELPEIAPEDPSKRQMKQLRQSVYAHIEDPKIEDVKVTGVRKQAMGQFKVNNTFGRGKGEIPIRIGEDWPIILDFSMVDNVQAANDSEVRPLIDFLLLRYARSRILGGRVFGSGYYGFPIVQGLNAMWLMLAATGWLARLHAGADRREAIEFQDVHAALLLTDRNAGRAPWLGGKAERLRHTFLDADHGFVRVLDAFRWTED